MNDHTTSEGRRTTTADLSWMLWTAIGIAVSPTVPRARAETSARSKSGRG